MPEGWSRLSESTRMALVVAAVIVVAGAAIGITALLLNHASASPSGNPEAPAVYELQAWVSGATSLGVSWSCDVSQPQGAVAATPASGSGLLRSVPDTLYSATGNSMSCVVTKQEVGTIVVQLYRDGTEVDSVNSGVSDGQSAHVGS